MSDFGITTALQYSGGRDSRAVLHMFRNQLDKIIVVWMNAGDPYPDTLKDMHRLAAQVPHFLILHGDVNVNIEKHGYPSDVVPIVNTTYGTTFAGPTKTLIQSTFDCCSRSIWQPLHQAMRLLGIKKIIRGQRNAEKFKNTAVQNGSVIDGVEYVLPLESWSVPQVEQYLKDNHVKIPDYYTQESDSHDCMRCTGYLAENVRRIRNLREPVRDEVNARLAAIRVAIEQELQPLKALS